MDNSNKTAITQKEFPTKFMIVKQCRLCDDHPEEFFMDFPTKGAAIEFAKGLIESHKQYEKSHIVRDGIHYIEMEDGERHELLFAVTEIATKVVWNSGDDERAAQKEFDDIVKNIDLDIE